MRDSPVSGDSPIFQSTNALRVVLVESHDDTRELYADYLRYAGFDVLPVNATDAALAHAHNADAVVTDLAVHGSFDGIELVRRVRRTDEGARTAIVVLTAYVLDTYRMHALHAGADVFLPKPCLPEVLAAELRRAVALNRRPKRKPRTGTANRKTEKAS